MSSYCHNKLVSPESEMSFCQIIDLMIEVCTIDFLLAKLRQQNKSVNIIIIFQ